MHFSLGVHKGLGMDSYHSWRLDKAKLIEGPISCSTLKAFDKNPFAWIATPDRAPTDAMRKGTLFDAAVTSPEELGSFVVSEFDNFRTKEAREWRDSMSEQGKVVVTAEEIEHAKKARDVVFNHRVAGEIVSGAEFQVGVVSEVGGIPAKCLIDILPSADGGFPETLVDYKTISTGLDDESIRKAIGTYKYHWQAAFYRTLSNKVFDDRVFEEFSFIFQDVNTLEVRVVTLEDDALLLGGRGVKSALDNFIKAAYQGIHSRYENTNSVVGLMPYHSMAEDEELARRQDGMETSDEI